MINVRDEDGHCYYIKDSDKDRFEKWMDILPGDKEANEIFFKELEYFQEFRVRAPIEDTCTECIHKDKSFQQLFNEIGNIEIEGSDNLGIILCGYFEDHIDCPDEEIDEEFGWKPWAINKSNEFLHVLTSKFKKDI